MELKQGKLFHNRYLLVSALGSGASAQVWKAQDTKANNLVVALKVFSYNREMDTYGLQNFEKEFTSVYNLKHSNLLPPTGYDICDGTPYLVMQYCENGSTSSMAGRMDENDVIKFIMESKNTSGGDGDEFYELVLKKIIDETPWREEATKAVLLIADAAPHPVGYSYRDYVVGNQIDWREEARKAADRMIKVDTVTITDQQWYKELSAMTNGVSAPFSSSHKTARLVEAATLSRGAMESRAMFRKMADECEDTEVSAFMECYRTVCDSDETPEDKAEK